MSEKEKTYEELLKENEELREIIKRFSDEDEEEYKKEITYEMMQELHEVLENRYKEFSMKEEAFKVHYDEMKEQFKLREIELEDREAHLKKNAGNKSCSSNKSDKNKIAKQRLIIAFLLTMVVILGICLIAVIAFK